MVKYRTLDGTFDALSHATRRGIVLALQKGEKSVTELARPYSISLPAVSKHLHVLETAGLIFRYKAGRIHYCRLATEPLKEVEGWLKRFQTNG